LVYFWNSSSQTTNVQSNSPFGPSKKQSSVTSMSKITFLIYFFFASITNTGFKI
jgi:hypothetical protein